MGDGGFGMNDSVAGRVERMEGALKHETGEAMDVIGGEEFEEFLMGVKASVDCGATVSMEGNTRPDGVREGGVLSTFIVPNKLGMGSPGGLDDSNMVMDNPIYEAEKVKFMFGMIRRVGDLQGGRRPPGTAWGLGLGSRRTRGQLSGVVK